MSRKQLGLSPTGDGDVMRKTDGASILYRVESTETFLVAGGCGLIMWNESILNGRLVVNGIVRVM